MEDWLTEIENKENNPDIYRLIMEVKRLRILLDNKNKLIYDFIEEVIK